ncbi:DUF4840 domain-containing protein [Bacteroides rodentium]|uniref:DUF4840 domain-containing protein n=1 Tax=Bacteroides rodentium TaxID=691816 RepID=UPI0004700365|nr:DUF4840 domain-containing protein [Bacteroides rodentium]
MTTKGLCRIVALFFCVAGFIGCNNDDDKFSSAEIQQALFDMKGTYNGTVEVSYYQGKNLATFPDEVVKSKDSLIFQMSLLPVAEMITDENLSRHLREINQVEVKAGYEFYQMDQGHIHFVLHPKEAIIWGGYGAPQSVRIEFSQIYGGDVDVYEQSQSMLFNISPTALWIGNEKSPEFSQLVYNFMGESR